MKWFGCHKSIYVSGNHWTHDKRQSVKISNIQKTCAAVVSSVTCTLGMLFKKQNSNCIDVSQMICYLAHTAAMSGHINYDPSLLIKQLRKLTTGIYATLTIALHHFFLGTIFRKKQVRLAIKWLTKQFVREKVWWPGIDRDVDTIARSCIPCQAQGLQPSPEPSRMPDMPSEPWKALHVDICRPFLNGESLSVLIDAYSRWLVVYIIKNATAKTLIHCWKKKHSQLMASPSNLFPIIALSLFWAILSKTWQITPLNVG